MIRFFVLVLIFFEVNIGFGQTVAFNKIVSDSLTHINFINNTHAPITLTIKKTKDTIPFDISLGDLLCNRKDSLVNIISFSNTLKERDSTFSINNFVKISYSIGKRLHKDSIKDHLYELPFQKGKRYKIIQGFNGSFSHQSKQSKYAIDFKIPIGDTIIAARSGHVVYTVSHFTEHGGKDFIEKANKIMILHDDGTVANYVHLDTNGVLVHVNDYVKAGQPIGIAGFTGYSTRPHLHFVVRNFDEAVPVTFEEKKNIGRKSGIWVKK